MTEQNDKQSIYEQVKNLLGITEPVEGLEDRLLLSRIESKLGLAPEFPTFSPLLKLEEMEKKAGAKFARYSSLEEAKAAIREIGGRIEDYPYFTLEDIPEEYYETFSPVEMQAYWTYRVEEWRLEVAEDAASEADFQEWVASLEKKRRGRKNRKS